jgi:hypothetical protein
MVDDTNYATEGQQLASIIALAVAALSSVFGSISILYIFVKGQRWKSPDYGVYNRIVAGRTVMDIFVAWSLFISPYLQIEDPNRYLSTGVSGIAR